MSLFTRARDGTMGNKRSEITNVRCFESIENAEKTLEQFDKVVEMAKNTAFLVSENEMKFILANN